MLVHDLLHHSAQKYPQSMLLAQASGSFTYGDMSVEADGMCGLLMEQGLKKGERVGLLLRNSRLYVAAYYGSLKAGGVIVPLHAQSDARTIERQLRHCGARALLLGPGLAARVTPVLHRLADLKILVMPEKDTGASSLRDGLQICAFEAARSFAERARGAPSMDDLQAATIVYTSGSTGRARGAVLTHLNLTENTRSIVSYLHLRHEDRVLVVLPFPYVYGKSLLNTHVCVGGSVVLHDSLVFPNSVLDAMQSAEVTGFSGVPSTYAMLLNRSDMSRRRFPALRYVTQAGGPMPVPHLKRLREALPGVEIVVMYGATEASARLAYLASTDLARKMGSIGKAIPGVSLAVRRKDGSEADVGEVGELVARGRNIMKGYWRDPEATSEVLDHHGFHTGDLGWKDEEGYFWITGRSREMIKSGAHRIAPGEIEEELLEHSLVSEVAVVGIPDEFLGEAVVAFLTLREPDGSTEDEILSFCRSRLPQHKIPRVVHICADLPRNPNGKIDKRKLCAKSG
ncbi:MAG: class I adenylate-forming enzyme family protein [Acidobacteriota bacterium]